MRFPVGTGIAGWVLATTTPLIIEDVQNDPRFARDVAAGTGYVPHGLMAVPLLYDERALGVLEVLDRPQESRFTLGEMELLGLFANQAAIALDLLQRARAAESVLAGEGDLVLVARVAAALDRLDEDARPAGRRLLAALEETLRSAGGRAERAERAASANGRGRLASLRVRAGESLGAFAGVARNPALRRLALALTGSELGAWGYAIALSVLVFRSGGASALGVLALVLFVPPGLAAPFTSLLGDRFSRVRVMVVADLVRACLWGLAAFVAFSGAPIGFLYAIVALSGIAGTAFRPAQAAALPSLARSPAELTAANVVSSTIESVTVLAGPALGGVIVAVTQPGVAFVVAVGTFLWSALLVSRVRPLAAAEKEPAVRPVELPVSVARSLLAGAEAVVREPPVRVLVAAIGAQTLVSGALNVFVPLLALGPLGIGESGLGSLWSALGVGGILGAFASAG